MMRISTTFLVTALLLHGIGAQAASLDKDVCAKLKDEQAQLEQAGLRATIAKGPGWAKGNLAPDKILQVRRLIEVDEQLLFRCQGQPLVLLPSNVDADPVASAENNPDGDKDADGKPVVAKAAPGKEDKPPAAKKAAVVKTDKPAGEAKAPPPAKKAPAAPKASVAKTPAPGPAKQAKGAPGASEAVKTAKPKPAPKKKVDDAYKPPPAGPGDNPFAAQDAAKK
jgi:hypothetical protein